MTDPTRTVQYVECDIPPGMTVRDWRRARRAAATAADAARQPLRPRRRRVIARLRGR